MTNVLENKIKLVTFAILAGISLFAGVDVYSDIIDGLPLSHLIHEIALWIFSMIGAIYQFRIIKWQRKEIISYREKVTALETAREVERKDFRNQIAHLSNEFLAHIDQQFNKWHFTRSEKEIALLLIKGLSMKEIADIRGSSESTVRQQSSLIYKKSHLGGRMELSAFFLDDILALSNLPAEEA